MKRLVTTAVVSTLLSLSVCAVAVGADDMGEGLSRACSSCHSARRVCRMLGAKDSKGWEKTVRRMVENGADISQDSVGAIADYLDNLKPGTGPMCP